MQARTADDEATYPALRLEGALLARRLGWVVMRPGPKVPTREVMVPVDGGAIRVRLYEPSSTTGKPRPLYVFLHGGGWCVGDLDQRDPRCRTIADAVGCVVASVDYRMAPENAFPVPLDDSFAALRWLVDHSTELGIDPERVAIGGESAGANLAAAMCLLARDQGGPALRFQWLDVPAVDLTMSLPSIERLATGYGLTKVGMERYRAAYLGDGDQLDPRASPLHADTHAGLPPALITTMEFDPLRDDGLAYVQALRDAGVDVEHHDVPGLIHASFAFTRLLPVARQLEDTSVAALRRALARG
ncbi:MAG: alpha/beta hydrolase [Actinomycetota bacterium]|nr:alpha/beta hydrolase [Actinomycetota bacterium]